MRAAATITALVIASSATTARAVEGMYLLDNLPGPALQQAGLKIPPAELRRLSLAVVQVASGGTGSFVSPRGLLVTNHHVAFRCLALLGSRKEHLGLLERGHLARTVAEELPCPGYDLLAVDEVRDVKSEVLAAVKPRQSWAARFEAIRLRKEELVERCEKDGTHICEVADLDGGAGYTLSIYRRVRDVRLVYAPPKDLGKFGGDIDNWMFPRHTADFTFLRAYAAPDGQLTPYAKENVPLATPQYLRLTREGLRESDLLEVIGFPARTSRHVTSHSVRFHSETFLPGTLELMRGLITLLGGLMGKDEDIRRKYASLESGLQNGRKYYEMSQQGMKRWQTLTRKLEAEKALAEGLAPADKDRLTKLLGEIQRVLDRYRGYQRRLSLLGRITSLCPTLRVAYDLVKWGKEKQKPNRMRKEERYKEKNVYRIEEAAARLEKEVNPIAERALLLHLLRLAEQLPGKQRLKATPWLLRWSQEELSRLRVLAKREKKELSLLYRERVGVKQAQDPLEAAVDLLFASTKILARNEEPQEVERAIKLRAEIFKMKGPAVTRLGDPLLRFARELEAELSALKEGPYREVEQHLGTVLHRRWVEEFKRPGYPDANFTVRLTYGRARSYRASATGKTHRVMSTLSELLAKERGTYPFRVPARLKAAFPERRRSPYFDRGLGDIPVNFTATLDTTGGNSGSPVLDAKGRLVGLLFDGTPESILSDWQWLEKEQRAICLDIRFALYLASLDRADHLLKELSTP